MNLKKLTIETRRKAKAFRNNFPQTKNRSETIRYLIEFTAIFLFKASFFPAPFFFRSLTIHRYLRLLSYSA